MKLEFKYLFFIVVTFSFNLLGMQPEGIVYHLCSIGNAAAITNYFAVDAGYTDDEKNAALNFKDAYGNTPLHIATVNGFRECVRILLNQDNINLNINNDERLSPFMKAIIAKDNAIIDIFLERDDLDVNTTAPGDIFDFQETDLLSPLCIACDKANKELISKLLNHKNIDLNLVCSDEYFFQRIIEVCNIDLLNFVMENEKAKSHLKLEKYFLIRAFCSLQNSDMLDEEIERTFEVVVNFCSGMQVNAVHEIYGQGIIHCILCSDFNGLKTNLVDIVLKRNVLDITMIDCFGCTALDICFELNEPELLKKLFHYCLKDYGTVQGSDTIRKIAEQMVYRSHFKSYQMDTFKKKNWSLFFSSLFNSFCSLGVDGLNMDVSGCNCNICSSPLHQTGHDGRHSFVLKLECGHLFGVTCLSEWIKINSTCPACEKNIFTPSLFDSCEIRFPTFNHKNNLDLSSTILGKKRSFEVSSEDAGKRSKPNND
jgi:hypothetical protein